MLKKTLLFQFIFFKIFSSEMTVTQDQSSSNDQQVKSINQKKETKDQNTVKKDCGDKFLDCVCPCGEGIWCCILACFFHCKRQPNGKWIVENCGGDLNDAPLPY